MGTILFGIGLERMKIFLSQNKVEDIFLEMKFLTVTISTPSIKEAFFQRSSFQIQAVLLFLKFLGNYRGLTTFWERADKVCGASGPNPLLFYLQVAVFFYIVESISIAGSILIYISNCYIQPVIEN